MAAGQIHSPSRSPRETARNEKISSSGKRDSHQFKLSKFVPDERVGNQLHLGLAILHSAGGTFEQPQSGHFGRCYESRDLAANKKEPKTKTLQRVILRYRLGSGSPDIFVNLIVGKNLLNWRRFFRNMLLWIPPYPSAAQTHHGVLDDNEKGDKLRRRAAQARCRNILMVIGFFILAFFATVSQVQYTQQRHAQPGLRTSDGRERPSSEDLTPEEEAKLAAKAKNTDEETDEEKPVSVDDDFFAPHADLPEDSIYRLTLTDVTGNQVDMSQFAGMVSLVVNTACH